MVICAACDVMAREAPEVKGHERLRLLFAHGGEDVRELCVNEIHICQDCGTWWRNNVTKARFAGAWSLYHGRPEPPLRVPGPTQS